MALKKSQLYSSLWQSCDELRGGMDASQYKDYVLTLLFMKYVTDKYAGKPDAIIEVPEGGSFTDMAKLKGDKEIGDKINKIIARLAEANDLKNVIDQADFNDEDKLGHGKEMQDRLSKLVAIFDGLDFRANRADGDDLLGDAYEYLMRNFATESGKSKGQFYTPAEVSRIMAKVVGIGPETRQDQTIYDPTCGSGSLLLKAADETPRGISIYGQENDNATWALARMNMILHGHPTAELWRGNTLSAPYFKNPDDSLKTFDFAVANPPFSTKSWSNGLDPDNDEFGRFEYGVPPEKNGDYAFLLHLIKSLKSKGKGAIILPHGVLFRGHKEADIRRNLIQRGLIKGIIGLPGNLFYGTGIPACILVIDKENAHARTGIFMIDASKGFMKDGPKNRLRSQDIHKIVDVFNRQLELPRYSRMVPIAEIGNEANEYNLNIPRYVDSSEPEDMQDLDAHLNGGIPVGDVDDLQHYWDVFPNLRDVLFQTNGRPGYCEALVDPRDIKGTVLDHPNYATFLEEVAKTFDIWRGRHLGMLIELSTGVKPREIIHTLSEDLLSSFADMPLLDKYDVYQRLMDYWAEVMQDDVFLISADGWVDAARPRGVIDDKEKKIKETPDLIIGSGKKAKKYKMDLIPPHLIAARFFQKELVTIDELEGRQELIAQELEEYIEENTDEEGHLEDLTNDKNKITKTALNGRLKELKDAPVDDEELVVLKRCLELVDSDSAASKAARDAKNDLDRDVLKTYPKLNEAEIKALVVEDKWMQSILNAIEDEVKQLIVRLSSRVQQLVERYEYTLPELEKSVLKYEKKVAGHLKSMGLKW